MKRTLFPLLLAVAALVLATNTAQAADADGDGWQNQQEILCLTDRNDPLDVPADTDGDGVCDVLEDSDTDGDGAPNGEESLCDSDPLDAGDTPADLDADGVCDGLDADRDGDGWYDAQEANCGSDPSDNADMPTDTDGDGVCDALETDDTDGDGTANAIETLCGSDPADAGSTPSDADGDGECDALDSDRDGDTWANAMEGACGTDPDVDADAPTDTDADGICDALEDADTDGDGAPDAVETICGSDPANAAALPTDTDGDGDCDAIDADADGDGWENAVETLCGTDPANAAAIPADADTDGFCDAMEVADIDGDGFANSVEILCEADPADAGSTPPDTDGDGTCDALDSDADGDGWANAFEAACGSDPADNAAVPIDTDADGICDAMEIADRDGDGVGNDVEALCGSDAGDAGSTPTDTDGDGTCDLLDDDIDGDSFGNDVEAVCGSNANDAGSTPIDTDGDGVCDALEDSDADGDGFPAAVEFLCGSDAANAASVPADADGDGSCDALDGDRDGDGWANATETSCGTDPDDVAAVPTDTDGDLICDAMEEADTDGDGVGNEIETLCGSDPADAGSTPIDADLDGLCEVLDDDRDNDGWANAMETSCGTDPDDVASVPTDTDGDLVCDAIEGADTDGDGFPNGHETLCGSDPNDAASTPTDSDGDGDCDAIDGDRDGDGWANAMETSCGTDPDDNADVPLDLDGDLICDAMESADTDGDGVENAIEIACDADPDDALSVPSDLDGDGTCDALDSDRDGDGWDDTMETACGTDPDVDADAPADTDADGICDAMEEADTDGDGFANAVEAICGSSAMLAAETPVDATRDIDTDGTCNALDNDADGDGWINDVETLCLADPNDAGDVPADADGNGVCDTLQDYGVPTINSVTITQGGSSGNPLAVDESTTVTITVDATDPNGDAMTYLYTRVSGPAVTLPGGDGTDSLAVTLPAVAADAQLVIRVSVQDARGIMSLPQAATIDVQAINELPTARIGGNLTVGEGEESFLSGAASSDADGQALAYAWTLVDDGGGACALTIADQMETRVVTGAVNSDTTCTVRLVVNDGVADSAAATATLTVLNTDNTAPAVNAVRLFDSGGGDTTYPMPGWAGLYALNEGVQLTVEVTATDADADPLTYRYTQTAGPDALIVPWSTDSTIILIPQIEGNASEILIFRIDVEDDEGSSAEPVFAIVQVNQINQAPTADAGPDAAVNEGDAFTLDAAESSDPDGDALTITWTQIDANPQLAEFAAGGGSLVGERVTLTAPDDLVADTTYRFEAEVDDGRGGTDTATVEVVVRNSTNAVPTVVLGDLAVDEGDAVTLTATVTEPDAIGGGDEQIEHTSTWMQTGGPDIAFAVNPLDQDEIAFVAPTVSEETACTFRLLVSDGRGGVVLATATVTIANSINEAPVAEAGADRTVSEQTTVVLDGSRSYDVNDPQRTNLTYAWRQVSGTAVTIDAAGGQIATFVSPTVTDPTETFVFELTVADNDAADPQEATDTVTVTVTNDVNELPIVDAGEDVTTGEGQAMTLVATATDANEADPSTLSYRWVQLEGTEVTLIGDTTEAVSFVTPTGERNADLLFAVTVTDPDGGSSTDTVTVHVRDLFLACAETEIVASNGEEVSIECTAQTGADAAAIFYEIVAINGQSAGGITASSAVAYEETIDFSIAADPTAPSFDIAAPAAIDFSLAAEPAEQRYAVELPDDRFEITLAVGENRQTTYEARQTWIRDALLPTIDSQRGIRYTIRATAVSEHGSVDVTDIAVVTEPPMAVGGGGGQGLFGAGIMGCSLTDSRADATGFGALLVVGLGAFLLLRRRRREVLAARPRRRA